MSIALVIASLLAILVIAYALIFNGRYTLETSITIKRPPEEVFAAVLDLRSWPKWSPWLLHDPDCGLEYSDKPAIGELGCHYSWSSPKIGSGTLTTVKIEESSAIGQVISFVKPFKSESSVTWEFKEDDGGCRVTWGMHGRLPFAMRWLAAKMPDFILKDYNSGLVMLRAHVDPGAPRFQLEFGDVVERPEHRCVGKSFTGTMAAMKKEVSENFPKLASLESVNKTEATMLTMCTKMDEKEDSISVSYGADPAPEQAPEGWEIFKVQQGGYFKTTLTGSYDMLAHAYHHAFNETRMRRLKYDSARHPYEVYKTDPKQVGSPDDFVTEIYLPIKS